MRKLKIFETAYDYFLALDRDAELAIVPLVVAAEAFRLTRAGVLNRVKSGRLELITIAKVKYVSASSVNAVLAEERAKVAKVCRSLISTARSGSPTTYQALMEELGMKTTVPQDRKQIGILLYKASKWSLAKHKLLLSAIVHRQGPGETMPSPDFFALARSEEVLSKHSLSNQDKRVFLRTHMDKIFSKANQMKYEE